MMRENNEVPDIEKLPRHEFDLDVEEQKRLQEQCDIEVQKVRLEILFFDLLCSKIWSDLMPKGALLRTSLAQKPPCYQYSLIRSYIHMVE